MADLSIQNHGSVFVLRAETEVGTDWIEEHIPEDAQTWCGGIVVEHRYICDIVDGAIADGLRVS